MTNLDTTAIFLGLFTVTAALLGSGTVDTEFTREAAHLLNIFRSGLEGFGQNADQVMAGGSIVGN